MEMDDNEATIQLNIAMCYNHFQQQRSDLVAAGEDRRTEKESLEGEGEGKATTPDELYLNEYPEIVKTSSSPKMDTNPIPESSEIALTPSNPSTDSQTLQESAVSLASTTNTDICVLETHYGEDERHHEYLDSDLEQHNNNNYMDDAKDRKKL